MTYGVGDLELLASADISGLGNSTLEPGEGLVVQSLLCFNIPSASSPSIPPDSPEKIIIPYLSTGNDHLNLATSSAHELGKLGDDTGEETKAVVLGQGAEEVLDRLARDARALDELGNDGVLVRGAQRRGLEDGGELGVLLDEAGEGSDGLGGGLEGGGLDGGSVLFNCK